MNTRRIEDDYNPAGTVTKVTRNVLGARGIDRISITENNATTHGYPLYDGHSNCRGVLTQSWQAPPPRRWLGGENRTPSRLVGLSD